MYWIQGIFSSVKTGNGKPPGTGDFKSSINGLVVCRKATGNKFVILIIYHSWYHNLYEALI